MGHDHLSVKINFIDKLHVSLQETGKAINRHFLYLTFFSAILSMIALDAIVVSDKFNIFVFEISISPVLFILCISFIVTFLFVSLLSLLCYEERLRDDMLRIYKELGFFDESLKNTQVSPLEYPVLASVLIGRNVGSLSYAKKLFSRVIQLFVLIFPSLSICLSVYKLWIIDTNFIILFGVVIFNVFVIYVYVRELLFD